MFLFTLEQARARLCHVGSVCSSHLVCATHLVQKRNALEQARITLCPRRFSVFISSRLCHASRGQTLRPRASTEHSLPCRFSVFLLTPKQTRSPRASMIQSVPCRFSKSLLCVSLYPRASTGPSVPHISWANVAP